MSKTRTIGIVREWSRHSVKRQREALTEDGVDVIYSIPDECPTWRDAIGFVRVGDTVKVELIQLLPEPKSAKVDQPAQDGRDALDEIRERRAVLVETLTGRSTADPKQRRALIRDMAASLGSGGRYLTSEQARANGEKAGIRRGRPKAKFDDATTTRALAIWESRKLTWEQADALLRPLGWTKHRAYKVFGRRD